jgi:hypothetical protein
MTTRLSESATFRLRHKDRCEWICAGSTFDMDADGLALNTDEPEVPPGVLRSVGVTKRAQRLRSRHFSERQS